MNTLQVSTSTATDGTPICPHCQSRAAFLKSRQYAGDSIYADQREIYKCFDCSETFATDWHFPKSA